MISNLSELRNQVTKEQREILDAIWQYYLKEGRWPFAATLYSRFDKAAVDALVNKRDSNLVAVANNPAERKVFRLTLLGVLVSSYGEDIGVHLIEYLKYVKSRLLAEHNLREIKSIEFDPVAGFDESQSYSFYQVLSISPFMNGGGGSKNNWSANLPPWIDDLVVVSDIATFFEEKALSMVAHGPVRFLSREEIIGYASEKDPTKNWDDYIQQIYDTLRNLKITTLDGLDKVIKDSQSRKTLDDLYLKVLNRTTASDWVGILSYQPIIYYRGIEGQDIVEQQLLVSPEYAKIKSEQYATLDLPSRKQEISEGQSKSANPAPRVFLCYAKQDKATVRKLYEDLNKEGLMPWFDEADLRPGQEWELEIKRTIQKSDFFLACLSSNSVDKRGFVQKEIKMGLEVFDKLPEGKIYLIPVRLEEIEIPERLKRWQWVDLFDSNGFNKLLQAIQVQTQEK